MKRTFLLILAGAALGAGAVWLAVHGGHSRTEPAETHESTAEKPAEKPADSGITRDSDGNIVVSLSEEVQRSIGIAVTNLSVGQLSPEVKGFGHVLDPAPLVALMTELAAAQSAHKASSNELARLQFLEGQGNASARATQAAEAAAQRDASSVQSARDRLLITWGSALAGRDDLPRFVQSLGTLEAVLVRIDLPLGEVLDSAPLGARLVSVSGRSVEAEFLGAAAGVDPQFQGRGYLFVVRTNTVHLLAGEAVTGYLRTGGQPTAGVIVPRDAVVRAEGKGWAYFLNQDGKSFTRREIPLDHPVDAGWFAGNLASPDSKVVVTGAQVLLSQELKSSLGSD